MTAAGDQISRNERRGVEAGAVCPIRSGNGKVGLGLTRSDNQAMKKY